MKLNPLYFKEAILSALDGINKEEGAPFGACIVLNDTIIATAHDTVLKNNDATCHAEINAIRFASKKLKNYQLTNCIIYCTSEPCPMCMAAIYFSNIQACYFLSDKNLSEKYGFSDKFIYKELLLSNSKRSKIMKYIKGFENEAEKLFQLYHQKGLPIC